jgi:exo-1,4-beta-D-glucosaminidase
MKKWSVLIYLNFAIVVLLILFPTCNNREESVLYESISLTKDWKMLPSDKLKDILGVQISSVAYNDTGWYTASVPGTVMGSLASSGIIEDPYFGINMQKIDPEQFRQPWWYRTKINLTVNDMNRHISLRFNGINYRADLWVNGKQVAGKEEFSGAFNMFTFNIDDFKQEGDNAVALQLWQYSDGEYSIGFVDWNPLPVDRNMGIFREVFLEKNEGVKIRSPFVYSKLDKDENNSASLYIQAELNNESDKQVRGTLVVDYELGKVEKEVSLNPGETLSIHYGPEEYPGLIVKDAELWWPNGMGNPRLYNLRVEFLSGGRILDRVEKKYGIREINTYLNEDKNRVFEINRKFILIKGGGWTDNVFLQDTKKSVEDQLKYVRHMNLNCIRCEGFWGKDETLYDMCDEYGILVMVGWSCQWEWEDYLHKPCDEKYGGATSKEDIDLIAGYWKDQVLWLRNHPAIFIWMTGSDKLPAPELEKKYNEILNTYDPSRPYATSAKGATRENKFVPSEVALVSDISGPTGMKMLGPYAFTPPVYWFTDTIFGGAWGFNTETCPGESVPPAASLKKMLPETSLWPIDKKYWEYHTGRNQFTTLDRFRSTLSQRYGESSGIDEFAYKSQVSNYEVMRPMFESFVANKPASTGIIQWKLNSAWPDLIWQLYDTYLQPNGSFYAVRKACKPLHAIYRYGFNDVYLANETLKEADSLKVNIRIFDINSKLIFTGQWEGNISANSSSFIYKIPDLKNLAPVWFLDLRVIDKDNVEIDDNTYWLSLKQDIMDYEAAGKLPWAFYTPAKQYADFTALNNLRKVKPEFDYVFYKEKESGEVTLKIKNPTETIAFFIFLDLIDRETQNPILPVFWDDNYVTLLPGEEKILKGTYSLTGSESTKPVIEVSGWNIDKIVLE